MSLDLSVIVPVFNEGDQLAPTIDSATAAIVETERFLRAEIVVADDGSSDGSGDAALAAETSVPVRVVRLPENRGKFHARLAGLEAAEGTDVLLLDAGVTLAPGGLRAIELELEDDPGAVVWNAHTLMETEHRPIAQFWTVVQDIAFAAYQEQPRRTSFGSEEFDRFPKGTTCFFVPRELMLEACASFSSLYDDFRHSSDDTTVIRWIAARERINISPDFACVYRPRTSMRAFFRHAIVRGTVFPDSFRDPGSRFFWPMVAFYPASAALALASLRRPVLAPVVLAGIGVAAGGLAAAKGRRGEEIASVTALAPVYALGHGFGMWKALGLVAARRLRGR